MKFLTSIKQTKGINFLEMTAALGLVGMGALVGTSLVTKTSKDANKTEQKLEIEGMIGNVKQILANKEVCEYNFQGQPIQQTYNQLRDPGADISDSSDDTNFIQTGTNEFLKTIQISNISTRALSAGDTENMELVVNFAPIGSQPNESLQNMERRITLQVSSINGIINSCFSDLAESSDVSLEEICTGTNSIYDSVNDQCIHFGVDTSNNCDAAAGQIMVGTRLNPSTLMIEPVCASANPSITSSGCTGTGNPSTSGIVSGVTANGQNLQVNCEQLPFAPIQNSGVINSSVTNCSSPTGFSLSHAGNRLAINCIQPRRTATPRPRATPRANPTPPIVVGPPGPTPTPRNTPTCLEAHPARNYFGYTATCTDSSGNRQRLKFNGRCGAGTKTVFVRPNGSSCDGLHVACEPVCP